MPKPKVLIIEDDPDLVEVLEYNLVRLARLSLPDVVILDLMLPLLDGFEVCRRLRGDAATADLLILMLTAKAEETDQIVGLSLGADDYMTKPFSVKVLLERLKALRRRRSDPSEREVIASQGITIDRLRHQASAGGDALDLTPTEFRILETLLRQPGRAYHRSELIESALGKDSFVLERTIDVHIRALRRKLTDHASLIETVRGFGYRFRDERA